MKSLSQCVFHPLCSTHGHSGHSTHSHSSHTHSSSGSSSSRHHHRPSPSGRDGGGSSSTSSSRSRQSTSSSRPPGDEVYVGKYKLVKTIGKGNFAKVKLAKHMPTGQEVCQKSIILIGVGGVECLAFNPVPHMHMQPLPPLFM